MGRELSLAFANVRRSIESLGYATSSPIDTLDQVSQVFRFLNIILVGLGSVGMVIAALGMLNTLKVSLLERTQEIALMMAIGARPKDMRHMFTVEAIVLSLIGILFATLIGFAIDLILSQYASGRGLVDHFSLFAHPPTAHYRGAAVHGFGWNDYVVCTCEAGCTD